MERVIKQINADILNLVFPSEEDLEKLLSVFATLTKEKLHKTPELLFLYSDIYEICNSYNNNSCKNQNYGFGFTDLLESIKEIIEVIEKDNDEQEIRFRIHLFEELLNDFSDRAFPPFKDSKFRIPNITKNISIDNLEVYWDYDNNLPF